MSANNFILINRKNFEVSLRDADTEALLKTIGKAKTLDKAVDLAEEYRENEIVEYGIQFTKKIKSHLPGGILFRGIGLKQKSRPWLSAHIPTSQAL